MIKPKVTEPILRQFPNNRELQRFLMDLSGIKSDTETENKYRNIFLGVSDIENPSELNGVAGNFNGSLLVAYSNDLYTIYSYDSSSAVENMPYVAGGSAGSWLAVASNVFVVGRRDSVLTKTTSYTTTKTDKIILVDATTGDVTITLYPSMNIAGQTYEIEKIDSSTNKVFVSGDTGDLINGKSSIELRRQYEYIKPTSTGSGYIF